jgi:adenylyl-sulfate kinase
MTDTTPNNIFLQSGHIDHQIRETLLAQKAITLWMTGLSASGKSTTAYALEKYLTEQKRLCYVLDGDNLRHGINANLGFSPQDRKENIRRTAEIARLMNDAGLIVITSLISPLVEDRNMAKEIIGDERFFEVYLSTPLDVCESRDPKALYRKARQGLITNFTGINAPYQPPQHPDLAVNTAEATPEVIARNIAERLINRS